MFGTSSAILEAQKLKDTGVSIVAVGIGLTDLKEVNAVASQTSFVFTASSFDVLSTINESLLKITCDISNGILATNSSGETSTATSTTATHSTAQTSTNVTNASGTATSVSSTTSSITGSDITLSSNLSSTPASGSTTLAVTAPSSTSAATTHSTTQVINASGTNTSETSTPVSLTDVTLSGQNITSTFVNTSATSGTTTVSISFEDTPPPLPEDVVISCGNSTKADIIFLLDASSSIGATDWKKQVAFASNLSQEFSFGPTGNLFGAVIFNSVPTKIFDLNTYSNQTAVANAILGIAYPSASGTYTDAALAYIRTSDMFGTSSGGRDNAQNILIIMTDGQSYFPNLTILEAQKLKDTGVSIVAVGIGLTDLKEVNAVASQTSFVFTASSFDVLSTINESLLKITCDISNGNVIQITSQSTVSSSTVSDSSVVEASTNATTLTPNNPMDASGTENSFSSTSTIWSHPNDNSTDNSTNVDV
ncbi:Collagen alpha-6(VI) chain [Bulinus truncatus]|nr:Collagen alpha-6(VI) chain [Bulinus truncatus]